jgi:hypothetical protein
VRRKTSIDDELAARVDEHQPEQVGAGVKR